MERKIRTILLAVPAVGASMLLALPAAAAGYGDQKQATAQSEQRAQGMNGGEAKPQAKSTKPKSHDMRASKLIGKELETRNGENIGEIQELLVDLQQGKVVYAVVEADVKDRAGERRVAVPFEKIRAGAEDKLVLQADRAQLATFPIAIREGVDWRLDAANPATRASAFNERAQTRAENFAENRAENLAENRATARAATAGEGATAKSNANRPGDGAMAKPAKGKSYTQASAILDADLHDRAGKDVGNMEDLVVTLGTGKIQYGVAEFDPSWFEMGKLVAVPIESMQRREGKLTLVMDRNRLEGAPSFDRDNWPDINTAEFRDRFERYDRSYAQRTDKKR